MAKRATAIAAGPRTIHCAVYTRKSTEEGLEQEYNSLDAQFDACAQPSGACWTIWHPTRMTGADARATAMLSFASHAGRSGSDQQPNCTRSQSSRHFAIGRPATRAFAWLASHSICTLARWPSG